MLCKIKLFSLKEQRLAWWWSSCHILLQNTNMWEISYSMSAAQCLFPVIPHGRGKVEGWSECRSRWQATLDSFTAIFTLSSVCASLWSSDLEFNMFHLLSFTVFTFNFPFKWLLLGGVCISMGFFIFHTEKFKKRDSCCLFLVLFTSSKIPTALLQRTLPFTTCSCSDTIKKSHPKLLRHTVHVKLQ